MTAARAALARVASTGSDFHCPASTHAQTTRFGQGKNPSPTAGIRLRWGSAPC